VIDLREERDENAYDLTGVDSESVSHEINEGDLDSEKHDEQGKRNCGEGFLCRRSPCAQPHEG
jgi:hypothetical protein